VNKLISTLPTASLNHRRILLRADLNVPLAQGHIVDDYKLQALQPTVDLILEHGGTITLLTHIGRPTSIDSALSTRHLIPWFKCHGYTIAYAPTLEDAYHLRTSDVNIIMVENLRFFPGEKNHTIAFAQTLANLGDSYVNDAFATLHRPDTSITLLPLLFKAEQRTIGLLVEQELHVLQRLKHNPAQPFMVICGGGKIADKLPMLTNFLTKAQTLIVCPALVFTFAQIQGKKIGKSLVNSTVHQEALHFLQRAHDNNVTLIMPQDYQIALDSFNGPLTTVDADQFPDNGVGISIGPKTAQAINPLIRNAQTIFFNGLPGTLQRPETLQGVQAIFNAMGQSSGLTVIGGGDSVAAARFLGLDNKIGYLSTGGGAALAYLADEPLPGLAPFIDDAI
jgi:phosphoglycerate kinase